ncbi:hypothetical protein [Prevotella denticola]|uniref:hypothetical protein n=1 Tax=Prevotella denticola TaxID=28129 RepID=UPI0028EE7B05|nr:hypothetical protein [Prevotella denticola]
MRQYIGKKQGMKGREEKRAYRPGKEKAVSEVLLEESSDTALCFFPLSITPLIEHHTFTP